MIRVDYQCIQCHKPYETKNVKWYQWIFMNGIFTNYYPIREENDGWRLFQRHYVILETCPLCERISKDVDMFYKQHNIKTHEDKVRHYAQFKEFKKQRLKKLQEKGLIKR